MLLTFHLSSLYLLLGSLQKKKKKKKKPQRLSYFFIPQHVSFITSNPKANTVVSCQSERKTQKRKNGMIITEASLYKAMLFVFFIVNNTDRVRFLNDQTFFDTSVSPKVARSTLFFNNWGVFSVGNQKWCLWQEQHVSTTYPLYHCPVLDDVCLS